MIETGEELRLSGSIVTSVFNAESRPVFIKNNMNIFEGTVLNAQGVAFHSRILYPDYLSLR